MSVFPKAQKITGFRIPKAYETQNVIKCIQNQLKIKIVFMNDERVKYWID